MWSLRLLLVVAGLVLGCKARSSPRQVILDAIVAAERAVEEKDLATIEVR
jgi:hypothetical protein